MKLRLSPPSRPLTPASGPTPPAEPVEAPPPVALEQVRALVRFMFAPMADILVLPVADGRRVACHGTVDKAGAFIDPAGSGEDDPRSSPGKLALFAGEEAIIPNLAADARWPDHAVSALSAGMKACWALPIRDPDGGSRAALVLYFGEPRSLAAADRQALDALAPLVADALRSRTGAAAGSSGQPGETSDFHSLADTIPGCVYQRAVYPDGTIKYLYINDYSREIFGLSPQEILNDPESLFDHYSPEYRKIFRRKLVDASREMKIWDVEASILTRDGRTKFTHAIAKPTKRADGSVLWTGVILDATRIKQAEEAAAAAEERTRTVIVESLSQGFLLYDSGDRLAIRNSHFLKLFPSISMLAVPGASYADVVRAEMSRGGALDITKGYLGEAFAERLAQHHNRHSVHEYQLDSDRWIQVNEHRTEDGGTAVLYTDVSELKRRERKIQHLAHHDSLTGLANRILFRQRVEEAVMAATTRGAVAAVFCLDLDHFKSINDTLGHPAGDSLLKTVAKRLQACLRDTDTASRLGGDEFALIVTNLPSAEHATNLAWRILGSLSEPVDINGQLVYTGTSIGIALSTDGAFSADSLLKNADLALYRAKSDGRGTFRFYEPQMDARAQERRSLEIDLRKAIAFGQLELHYQPLVNVETSKILAMEALVRWRHPERGLVPPGDFIGIAEETGIIVQLGDWVLTRACEDCKQWPADVRVAVNLSPAQFKSRDLADRIMQIVKASGIAASRLELEITESLLFRDTESNLATLHRLKEFGVQIAMDDFGTGYSSLSNLRSFPFDKIKIDRSFVAEMSKNRDSQAIIQAVLNLGKSLGMKTTAEGVESLEQVAYLRAQGCTEVQGFYYSAAIPGSAVGDLLTGQDWLVTPNRKSA